MILWPMKRLKRYLITKKKFRKKISWKGKMKSKESRKNSTQIKNFKLIIKVE